MNKTLLPLLAFLSVSLAAIAAPRPNILVIMCDDLGYADVGFNGCKDGKTPALDKLANSGTILSAAYVAHPFCGPSRTGFMTGRYPHKIGAQFNLPRNSDQWGYGITTDEVFMSQMLKDAGYYTGAIGKWHLGSDAPYHPNKRGFEHFYGFLGGGHKYFPEKYQYSRQQQIKKGVEVIPDNLDPMQRNGVLANESEYLTDEFSNEAVRFVNQASEQERPFFLYLAYNAPHSPMEATQSDLAVFSHIEDTKRRIYLAMVYAVDRGVAKVVDALKANSQLENTLIVFLSDNGGKLKYGSDNGPLTGEKGDTTEAGYRTPMFIHWPNQVEAGKRYDHPFSTLDCYPTFAALAGAKAPENKALDGKNVWSDLMAGRSARKGEMIFALRHRERYTDVGARRDEWKITRTGDRAWRLYNIEEDISETNDLSKQHPERLQQMVSAAEKWSRTHAEPLWFHDTATGIEWEEAQMPHFDETFSLK